MSYDVKDLIKNVYELNQKSAKQGGFVTEVSQLETLVVEDIDAALANTGLGLKENDYLILSQGSCNTGEFNLKTSDVDIELLLSNELTPEKRNNLEKYLRGIQDAFKTDGKKRVKIWLSSFENMKNVDNFKGSPTLDGKDNDGWWNLAGQVLLYDIFKSGKYIKGNRKEFQDLKDSINNLHIKPEFGPELYYTALFDLFEGLYAKDKIDEELVAKAVLRGIYAAYLTNNGTFLCTYNEISDVGHRLLGINEDSTKFDPLLKKVYKAKISDEKITFDNSDMSNLWNIFKIFSYIQLDRINKIELDKPGVSEKSETSIKTFKSKRFESVCDYTNFENTKESTFLHHLYVETMIDCLCDKPDKMLANTKIKKLLEDTKDEIAGPITDDKKLLRAKISNFLGAYTEAITDLKTIEKKDVFESKISDEPWAEVTSESKIVDYVSLFSDTYKKNGQTKEAIDALIEGLERVPTKISLWSQLIKFGEGVIPDDEMGQYKDIFNALENKEAASYIDLFDNSKEYKEKTQIITKFKEKINDYLKERVKRQIRIHSDNVGERGRSINNIYLKGVIEQASSTGNCMYTPSALNSVCTVEFEMMKLNIELCKKYKNIQDDYLIKRSDISFSDYHSIIEKMNYLEQKEYFTTKGIVQLFNLFEMNTKGYSLDSSSKGTISKIKDELITKTSSDTIEKDLEYIMS